jgi:hypothetical protein
LNDSLANILNKASPPPKPEPQEDEFPRPDLTGDYVAFAAYRGRNLPCLHLYFNAAERKAHGKKKKQVQYVHLESDDEKSGLAEDGLSFTAGVYMPEGRMLLTVRGRNIEHIYDLLALHKLAWIRSIDDRQDRRGVIPDDAVVITGLSLVEEKDKE